jgi:hypothetical protein
MNAINLKPIDENSQVEAVVDVVSALTADDVFSGQTASDLDELSSNTLFEGIEVNPDAIFTSGENRFEASATVYVTLTYGGSRDNVSIPDSYPAIVRGHFNVDGEAEVEQIEVDTSSFFEDEPS